MCTFEDGLCKDWLKSKAAMKIIQKGFHLILLNHELLLTLLTADGLRFDLRK